MKLGLHRNGRCDIAVDEVINEMIGLAVLPIQWTNGERPSTERIPVQLTERLELHCRQGAQSGELFNIGAGSQADTDRGKGKRENEERLPKHLGAVPPNDE